MSEEPMAPPRILPPDPIVAMAGGTLRFAVGSPEGPRSSTWNVVSSSKTRDVYVGPRPVMGGLKLSLHESGVWRFAHTTEYAEANGFTGDRVLSRYEQPPEFGGEGSGWRRAVTIICPTANLGPAFPEKASSTSRPISWWSAPDDRHSIWFEVMIGDPECASLTINGIGEVGRLVLPGGGGVWVLANEVSDEGRDEQFRQMREAVAAGYAASTSRVEFPSSMAWGFSNDDGHPIIWDIGRPGPPRLE